MEPTPAILDKLRAAADRVAEAAHGYAAEVVDDPAKAGRLVRLAARRHLDDLERQADPEWPFRFDAAKAFRAVAFIEALPHVKGTWAARGERLKLSPWQVWITASVFGWVRKDTGLRRFTRALILVPRKNGKSAWAAGIGLYLLAADGEHGAEVYSGATSEKQAHEVFRPAALMAAKTPRLLDRFGLQVHAKRIVSMETGSRFEPVIARPGDGSSPSCAIVDEYHEHPDDHMVETFRTGMGARTQPLLLMISTAGDNVEGPCAQACREAETMLTGAATDEALFAAIYGLDADDDWTTDEALRKANPNADVSVSMNFLRAERDDALRNARRQAVFKTKHLNQWVGARTAYFNMELWRRSSVDRLSIDDFRGAPCWIGLDLASVSDMTAIAYLFPMADGRFAVFAKSYLPEIALAGPNRRRYAEFLAKGELIVAGDGMLDQDRIEADLRTDLERYAVRGIAFDPWNAMGLVARLDAAGATMVEFRKTTANVSAPMKTLAGLIDDGKIVHAGQSPLAWCLSNVVTREDTSGNVRPVKAHPAAKIDAADALLAALALHLADEATAAPDPVLLVV